MNLIIYANRVVIDLEEAGAHKSFSVVAEIHKHVGSRCFGTPYPNFGPTEMRASCNADIIPNEIAKNKKMLAAHLFLVTGEEWVVF